MGEDRFQVAPGRASVLFHEARRVLAALKLQVPHEEHFEERVLIVCVVAVFLRESSALRLRTASGHVVALRTIIFENSRYQAPTSGLTAAANARAKASKEGNASTESAEGSWEAIAGTD